MLEKLIDVQSFYLFSAVKNLKYLNSWMGRKDRFIVWSEFVCTRTLIALWEKGHMGWSSPS